MRNLRNIRYAKVPAQSDGPLSRCAWDVSTDSIFYASGPSEKSPLLELRRHTGLNGSEQKPSSGDSLQSTLIAAWDALCPLPDTPCDQVLSVQYFPDDASTCLVLAGGDVVVVREQPFEGQEKIEIVGSVDAGIAAACWSPDEELLALCTKNDTFLFMTRDFDNVASAKIVSDDLKASKHVSVGWGKAETQFRGKGAKALRDPTVPEKVDEGLLSSNEDHSTTISWRGDGQYVALNSLQASHRRVIRIYSREGVLEGVTEPVDYLEGALSWRPAGNLLAGVQRLQDGAKIVFFERNGLKHGEFALHVGAEDLQSWASSIALHWNVDSSVLAVLFRDRVQLWTMGNYHYYLKSEVRVPEGPLTNRLSLSWHPDRPLLFSISADAEVTVLEYQSTICRGAVEQPQDYGTVAVIDGDVLKLTDMRYSNIPPPMATYEVPVGASIIDCAIKNLEEQQVCAIALTNSDICVIEWQAGDLANDPTVTARIPYVDQVRSENGPGLATQVAFVDSETVALLVSDGVETSIWSASLKEGSFQALPHNGSSQIQEILHDSGSETDRLYIGHADGAVTLLPASSTQGSSFDTVISLEPTKKWNTFEIAYPQSSNLEDSNGDAGSRQSFVVTLIKNGQLCANATVLASNCTSFLVTRDHIIFTTSKHLLKFVHLVELENLEVPPDTPEADERCRSIERGAKLVTVVPSRSALILQMPRGNLETIYPRALVLAEIRRQINSKRYRKAFLECRRHRVDMNILHDHNPPNFINDVPLFIEQLDKIEYIDLFLSQLRNEDVSLTMYKETTKSRHEIFSQPATSTASDGSSKVNLICNEFIQTFRRSSKTRLQNLITAHVCKTPPDLVAGLKEVAKLEEEGSSAVESAVEHICFLVDVNKLFDAALGLYNLKLALLVAQQSQKDPREYLPFLNNLHAQSPLRMKFEIDNNLGRRRLCLEHLKELEAFEELLAYTDKHELYQDSLDLYRYQEDNTEVLMKHFADYLVRGSRHEEAAIAYEYLQDYQSACESYQLANLWQESLSSAWAAGQDATEIRTLAESLIDSMIELKDHSSAAKIAYEHLNDIETAAKLYCRAFQFTTAARLLNLHSRRELLDTVLDAGLAEGMASMTELLADFKSQLNAQVPRLRELRVKKEQEPFTFYDAGNVDGLDIPDNVSLAATDASTMGGTLFTRYTNRTGTVGTNATRRTSKNNRREERKRARGKKGSVYEEEYLVNSIGRLIERVNTVHEDVSRLVTGLVQRRMRERAKAVQDAMLAVTELCEQCIPDVFETNKATGLEQVSAEVNAAVPNGATTGVQWENMEAARLKRQAPVVKAFSKLSLAGGGI